MNINNVKILSFASGVKEIITQVKVPKQRILLRIAMSLLHGVFWVFAQPSTAQTPSESAVFVDRAVLAYSAGQYGQALKELQEALRLNPDNFEAFYYQGLVYVALDRHAEAEASLGKAKRLQPGNVDVLFQLGALHFNRQEYETAEALLHQVYRADPHRPNVGYYLGLIEYRKKNYRAAIEFLYSNVPSDENFAQLARFYSSLAMSALGFPRQAQAEINEAIRLKPNSPLAVPAQRFGALLEKAAEQETSFRGEIKVGLFYDTNVPVVPNASSDLVATVIRKERGRQRSEGELASLNLTYTWLKTLDWEGAVSHRFLQTYNNHLTEFNTQVHNPSTTIFHRGTLRGMSYLAGSQLAYEFVTLGNTKFAQRWILNPFFTLTENSGNVTNLQFRFQAKDFFHDSRVVAEEDRDAFNYMTGPIHFFLFDQGRHYLKLGAQYDLDDAEGKNWNYHGAGLLAGVQYTLPWQDVRVRYDFDLHWRFHKHEHSLVPATAPGTKKRRDREGVHLLSAEKEFSYKSQNLTFSVDYLFDDNKSNLKPYDYDRHAVTAGVTWKF